MGLCLLSGLVMLFGCLFWAFCFCVWCLLFVIWFTWCLPRFRGIAFVVVLLSGWYGLAVVTLRWVRLGEFVVDFLSLLGVIVGC